MELPISEINIKKHRNKTVTVVGFVDSIAQTGGPTIFTVLDGSGVISLKGFEGAGVRAFPEIQEEDAIKATVTINEFQGELEGEISRVFKLSPEATEKLKQDIEVLERKRASVHPPAFLVHNKVLEKLKERFVKAATEIRLAIIKNRPIVVRHHNDCDGYSSGYALERAIVPLIIQQHGGGKAPWEFYTRAPCAAPFYDIEDSIKDAAHSLADSAKFSNKMPLVIIADTGSGEDDVLSIKQGKIHGIDFIVIDHHYFEKDLVSAEALVHINPFLVEEDGSKYSAGMLCTELARFINSTTNIEYLAALSGLSDRIDNPEVVNAYISLAAKQGYTKQLLVDIASLVDFVSAKLRFMEAREYIGVVFGDPIEKQKKLVTLLVPHIRKLEERGLAIARSIVKREQIGKIILQTLSIEDAFARNMYPKPGRTLGMIHDEIQEKERKRNVVSVGLLSDAIILRATTDSKFSVHDFLEYLNKKSPNAFPEGGGHHLAGSIKFVPSQQEAVIASLKSFLAIK